MKEAMNVDRSLLEASIKDAERDGPLPNLSELWKRACSFYNEQMATLAKEPNTPSSIVQFITPSVVLLRQKSWNIPILTVAGKKGRPSNKSNLPTTKKGKAERLKSYESNFAKMRRMMPRKFHKFINRAEAGSIKEAVRTKCLDCSHFEKKEITNCKVTGCPLFPYRPYQGSSKEPTENKTTVVATLPVIGNLK
jgi:hypothetical protein